MPDRTQPEERIKPEGRPVEGPHTTGIWDVGVMISASFTGTPTVRLLAAVEPPNKEKQVEFCRKTRGCKTYISHALGSDLARTGGDGGGGALCGGLGGGGDDAAAITGAETVAPVMLSAARFEVTPDDASAIADALAPSLVLALPTETTLATALKATVGGAATTVPPTAPPTAAAN